MDCCSGKNKEPWTSRFPDDGVDLDLLQPVVDQYRNEAGSLITVLQKAQDIYGYLPRMVLDYIAFAMRLKPSNVYGAATFYTQFRFKPVGKYLILLCKGTACHVNGADSIETALSEELKISAGETTADKLFTLDTAACLGCCSLAPVMMINGQAYGPLTPESAARVIRDIYQREQELVREGEQA